MSFHSIEYLNAGNILVGNGQRAWWYNEKLEDKNNPTHFDGFIPISIVEQRLFGWETLESLKLEATFEVVARDYDGQVLIIPEMGNEPFVLVKKIQVKSYKALGREDWVLTGVPEGEESGADAILSIQGETYGVHQLKRTFLQTGAEMFGGADEVGIVSAGLLKWGRRAWMTASIPERLHNDASGMDYVPQMTFSTSFDGSLPTSITRTYGIPVCDNTLDYELMRAGEKTGKFVLKHTKNSVARIKDAKAVLGLLTEQADEMDKALAELAKVDVSEGLFLKWLDKMVPVPDVKITDKIVSIQGQEITTQKVSTNGVTIAYNKREKLVEMWDRDPRVAPWKNTKLGILQLWNTFQTHESTIRGAAALGNKTQARVEANMMRTIQTNNKYSFARQDETALGALDEVLSEAPVTVAVMDKPKPKRAAKQNPANN